MASFSVSHGRAPQCTAVTCDKKAIACYPCNLTNLETFSEKISASTCSSKEKAGLKMKKKKIRWHNYREIAYELILAWSTKGMCEAFGRCIARYGLVDYC